jgi:hypothetical protein
VASVIWQRPNRLATMNARRKRVIDCSLRVLKIPFHQFDEDPLN